jgi:phage terminase small subunit
MNDKQIRFCEEYLIDFNATQAAIRAGYSRKTANEQASRLLANVNVSTHLSAMMQETSNKLGITREKVLQEIGRLAFADIRKLYNIDGALKSIHDLDDDAAAILAGVETYEEKAKFNEGEENITLGQTKKVKVYDKTKSLEMLAKHFKIYSDAPINNNNLNFGYGPEQPV